MPLGLVEKAKLDCYRNPQSSLCQLLPLLSKYNVKANQSGKEKTLQILFSAQSTAAIIYVIIVLLIYAFVFGALFYSSRGRSGNDGDANGGNLRISDTVVRAKKNKHQIEYYEGSDDNYV